MFAYYFKVTEYKNLLITFLPETKMVSKNILQEKEISFFWTRSLN